MSINNKSSGFSAQAMLQLPQIRKIHHTACHCRLPITVIFELDFELRDESHCLRRRPIISDLQDNSSDKEGYPFPFHSPF